MKKKVKANLGVILSIIAQALSILLVLLKIIEILKK